MNYIDIHCHLDMCYDIPSCVARARQADVKAIVTQGVNPKSNRAALELSRKYKEVKAALGLYPLDAVKLSDAEIDKEIQFIRENRKEFIAIGEVGLDFKEDSTEHERQKYIFNKIVSVAIELDKPIIVHSRKAENICIELLKKAKAKKVIMHCFSGKFKLVERIRDNGWFLSIPTNVKYSEQFQNIAKAIPLTNLFCETDSPFLHPDKEKNNEPANVIESYKTIAVLKGISLEDVTLMIAQNYVRLFSQ